MTTGQYFTEGPIGWNNFNFENRNTKKCKSKRTMYSSIIVTCIYMYVAFIKRHVILKTNM